MKKDVEKSPVTIKKIAIMQLIVMIKKIMKNVAT